MKKKIAIAAVAALGLGALAMGGLSGCRRGYHHGHGPVDPERLAAHATARVDDFLDDVDATDAQRKEIHALKDRLIVQAPPIMESGRAARGEFIAQWKSDRPDASRLHALVDAQADAYRKAAHDAVDAGVELHRALTPEQRAKIDKKIDRYANR